MLAASPVALRLLAHPPALCCVLVFVCPELAQGWVVVGATARLIAALGAAGSAPVIGVRVLRVCPLQYAVLYH